MKVSVPSIDVHVHTDVLLFVSTKITSAKVVFEDETAGDYIDVQVTGDMRFGTLAFNTTGGASKCPVEPHTVPREAPAISPRPGDLPPVPLIVLIVQLWQMA